MLGIHRKIPRETAAAAGLAVFYLIGLLGHYWEPARPWMEGLTPWVLLGAGAAVYLPLWRELSRRARMWTLLTYLATLFLEILGVTTGLVFGPYHYGPVLGLSLAGVPLIIGFNWMMLLLGFLRGIQPFFSPRRIVLPSLTAAAALMSFDILMEPAAIHLNYWQWHTPHIPLQNYAAWFLIALTASLAYRALGIRFQQRLPLYYTVIQLLFFTALYPLSP